MKIKVTWLVFVLAALVTSCDKEGAKSNTEIVGTWRLVEVLADPGNGSGTFQPVSSDKSLVFLADGTVTSNGQICHMSTVADQPSSGTYSLANSTIQSSDCSDPSGITFEKNGATLIINYPCIEPCRAKFTKAASL